MSELSLHAAQQRLREVAGGVCLRPEVPPDLAEELRQIYFTLRNHSFYMDWLKSRLDEMRAEMGRL